MSAITRIGPLQRGHSSGSTSIGTVDAREAVMRIAAFQKTLDHLLFEQPLKPAGGAQFSRMARGKAAAGNQDARRNDWPIGVAGITRDVKHVATEHIQSCRCTEKRFRRGNPV
ncbi:MAG: hypothetical protein HYU44_20110 [Betaproteobacteria bacterium]|nr:hypothetical protein [Betaproteobacteria bacterium]MBI2290200.1 hypothetical protein [Betaproteobacteria bacterium]MBI3052980.1 hypothetical protein [Betaproteobacteria bacterium]